MYGPAVLLPRWRQLAKGAHEGMQCTNRNSSLAVIGIDEVILHFNFGNRPEAFVREQMQRFMAEIALPAAPVTSAAAE